MLSGTVSASSVEAPLIQLRDVSRTFDDGVIVALDQINLSLFAGESVAIWGPSGSGKSTLLFALSGCDTPTAGSIAWRGEVLPNASAWEALRGREIGIVFQDFLLLPALTALENVELALMGRGISAAERKKAATALLAEVGLGLRLNHLPSLLSGGERQRVAIARGVAQRPALLLADEPTGNLDSASAAVVLDVLFRVQRSIGSCLVIVTHDETVAARCDRKIAIRDGRIVQDSRSPSQAARHGAQPHRLLP